LLAFERLEPDAGKLARPVLISVVARLRRRFS